MSAPHRSTVAPILVADCVSRAFGARRVLASASLRAVPGEVRAILGRNGIGKSTLMRIAVGLAQPDAGMVMLDGAPVPRARLPWLARRGLFFLPDHDLLSSAFTLREQLERFAACAAEPAPTRRERQDRLRELSRVAASEAQVEALLDARPHTFSGGELRRAELAAVLARRPRVLIADEPFRGIAPKDHEHLGALFRRLANDGCAVVLSGHEVPTLLDLVDHVTWCTAGTTYELGPPAVARVHDAFRRDYLGPASLGR